MAIAFDASASGGLGNPVTSLTWAHTCTGSDRILCVGAFDDTGGASLITGITYNSVGMTKIAGVQASGDRWCTLWYLIAPATGSNNIVISASSSIAMRGDSSSYTGAKQTGQPDSFNTGAVTLASGITVATTVVADNSWLVAAMKENVGLTIDYTPDGAERQTGNGFHLWDGGATVASGSRSMATAEGGENSYAAVLASIAPATAGGGAAVKRLMLLGVG